MDPDVHGRRFSALPPSSNRSGLGDRFKTSFIPSDAFNSTSLCFKLRPAHTAVESKPPPLCGPRLVASSPPRIPSDVLNIVRMRTPVHLAFGKPTDRAFIYVFTQSRFVDCLMLSRMCICVNDRAHENGTLPVCPSDVPRGGAVFVHLCVRCALVMFRVHAEDSEAQYDAKAAHPFRRSALNIVRVRALVQHAFDLSLMPCVCIRMGGWVQEDWHPSTTRPSDVTVRAEWFRSSHHPTRFRRPLRACGRRRKTGRCPRRPTRRFMVHCDLCSSRIRFELYEARVHARPAEGEADAPSSTLSVLALKATKRHHRLATQRRRTSVVSRASNRRHHRTPGGPLAPMAYPAEGVPAHLGLPSRSSRWWTRYLGVLTDPLFLIYSMYLCLAGRRRLGRRSGGWSWTTVRLS
ncbi:hypothetical protein C8Q77DRAFT_1122788 [Trametes polyzona]|nr:hypothetical protein C8Q77DRAFT_1122788 [Trametes polyzona]